MCSSRVWQDACRDTARAYLLVSSTGTDLGMTTLEDIANKATGAVRRLMRNGCTHRGYFRAGKTLATQTRPTSMEILAASHHSRSQPESGVVSPIRVLPDCPRLQTSSLRLRRLRNILELPRTTSTTPEPSTRDLCVVPATVAMSDELCYLTWWILSSK